jgi:hypothetical protein
MKVQEKAKKNLKKVAARAAKKKAKARLRKEKQKKDVLNKGNIFTHNNLNPIRNQSIPIEVGGRRGKNFCQSSFQAKSQNLHPKTGRQCPLHQDAYRCFRFHQKI